MKIEQVKADLEKNVSGIKLRAVRDSLLLENPEDLPKAALYLKESEDYKLDYLSSITAADYCDFLESVYHLYSIEKKSAALTLRVRCTKENPHTPSLVSIYRGAEFQERDNYDLFGIVYDNHPDLRRIMMWEGFEGFPMRKDYVQENSEELDEEDIAWLEKNNVTVPEAMKEKALKTDEEPASEKSDEAPKAE